MLSVPNRAEDDKFTNSIEGYRGSIHKLGRLITHDWFSVTFGNATKERYLFLFKARILISKVRRISEDRSVFQLKDIIRLPQVEIKDRPESRTFELVDKIGGHSLGLAARRDNVKELWLKEIREFASDVDDHIEDIQVISEATSTLASEAIPSEVKPFAVPQASEAQRLLAAALKTGIEEKKPKLEEEPKTSEDRKEEIKLNSEVSCGVQIQITSVGGNLDGSAEDDMSRRYTALGSSGKGGDEYDSSFSRRSIKQSSHVSDGLSSSRYESLSSKYGSESLSSSKYGSEALSSSKYGSEALSSAKYGSESLSSAKYGIESSLGGKYSAEAISSKYSAESSASLSGKYGSEAITSKYGDISIGDSTHTTRRSMSHTSESDGKYGGGEGLLSSSYSVKRTITEGGSGDEGLTSSSYTRKYHAESGDLDGRRYGSGSDHGDGDAYSYSRKTTTSLESADLGGSKYSSRRSATSEYGDTSGTKYTRTRVTSYGDLDDDTSREALLDKYSTRGDKEALYERHESVKRSVSEHGANDDVLSKFSKYERKISESRRLPKDDLEDAEIEAEMRRKYGLDSKLSAGSDSYEKRLSESRESTHLQAEKLSEETKFQSQKSTEEIKKSVSESESIAMNGKTIEGSDSAGSIQTTFKLRRDSSGVVPSATNGKPSFVRRLHGSNIEPGESAAFEVELAAAPDNFVWLKDNRPLSQLKRYKIGKAEEDKVYRLEIKEAEAMDAGLYSAVATNTSGKSTCSAQLIVHELTEQERAERLETDKPVFLIELKDTELLEDTYLRFMVKVKGEPVPTVTFYKDDIKIRESNKRCHIVKEAAEKGFYELVIPEVKQEDAGLYRCVASNKFGEISSEATVTVTDSKELFEDLPKEPLLEPGEKPVFIWKKDGVAFVPEERFKVLLDDDEDSLALLFQHVKPEDAGLYTCVAQTKSGHISCSAELTVHGVLHQLLREPEKPKLVIEKREAVASIGSSAMLELQVKGYPKPEVKWKHDGKPIEAGGKYKFLYEDEESMSLVIKDVQAEDAGTYQAEAKNELGCDSTDMTLTVKAPPKIKSKLEDMSQEAGLTIRIPVEVEGIPKPTVQFYKDGHEIKSSERIKIVEEDGKHVLIIEKSEIKDSGSYSIIATNEISQVSKCWNMDIHSKPRIVKKLGSDRIVSQKEEVVLKVEIEAKPKPEVRWYKNEEELTSTDHYVIKEDGDSYILKISGAVTTDSASYKVKANNIYGTVDDDCKVYVKTAPKIIQGLVDTTCTEYDKNIELDVKMEAYPKPTVKWYLDEMEITESRNEFTRIESDDGSKLVIKEVTSNLSGQYKCKVVNELGETETSAKLTVNCKPRFIKHLKDTTVDEGATLRLEVEVEACPEPTVKWLRNGREVSADARIKITRDTHRNESYHLAVDLIKYEEQGEYEVIVTNSLGTINCKSIVTVQKVTLTDAIEETEPPVRQDSQMEVIDNRDEPQKARPEEDQKKPEPADKIEKIEIEDLGSEEPLKPKEEETEKPKSRQAAPAIIDSTLKDKSQYASLDVSYVVAASGNPKPTAVWTLGGKPLQADSHYQISDNGEEFKLEIKQLDVKDAGVLECKISNPLGDVKKQATLNVMPEADLRKPKIKQPLEDQTVTKHNPTKQETLITADPVPEVTWYLNGKEITPNDFEKFDVTLDTEDRDIEDGLKESAISMTIPKSVEENSGKYTIKAKNKWGEAEASAQLTIVLRPEIEGPDDVSVVPGNSATFEARVHANPTATVNWYKDGKLIEKSDAIEIIEDVKNETYKLIIKNVQLSDAGRYSISAKNSVGESSSDAKLRTIKSAEPSTEKPKFITGLSDGEVEDGGEIVLMVRADGLPKPEIRWFFNGKPLEEDGNHKIVTKSDTQVTSTLAITNYNKEDAGQYKAMAVNVAGEAETTGQITMVSSQPSFGKRLERNEDVDEGEPMELKAKISGSPKPTVAWYKDGEPVPENDGRIKTTLLPDGTVKLTVDEAAPSDSGAYKLVIKNPNGETSSLCAVAVNPKPQRPKFVKCIKDVKASEGEPLRLEAQVIGYPPPEIKWLKDGVPIRTSSNVHFEQHPDGKVALIVDSVKPESAGNYTLQAVNRLGENENDAKVEIEKKPVKPEFIVKMQPVTVVEKFPAKFEVKAKGFPAPTVTWMRNGAEVIPDNKHIRISELPDGTSVLLIDACDKAGDAMAYKAVASNEAGDAQTTADLTVTPAVKEGAPEEAPALLHSLRDAVADEGQPLVMEVPFTANPMPEVEWFKDGAPLRPSDRILQTCDGKKVGLRIDGVTPADAGKYSVKLTNPLGSDSSEAKAGIHKVFAPPHFMQRFTDSQQVPKRNAKLYGKVSGVPSPEVTWYKDGTPLTPSDKHEIKRDGDICSLYISDCSPSDAGIYRAFAVNKEGSDTCEAKLDIVDEIKTPIKVEPPSFLKRIGDLDLYKGMTAKFTACATGYPEPKVEWYKDDQKLFPSNRINMEVDKAGLLRLTISGIDNDDLGRYSCKISNEHGSDICHAGLRFDELDAKPRRPICDEYADFDKHQKSGVPVPLSDAPIISRMTDRHCTLSWRPSIPSHPRAPVTYQLEMCELPHGDWFTARSGIRNCVCSVGNLEPFRDYRFRVRVENKYGISEPSPYATTYRQKLEPEPPRRYYHLPPGTPFHPDTSPYFPKDFDIERPPRDHMAQAPRFLRQEHPVQYGVKDQNTNLFWYVYGYPKPKMEYYFNDEPIGSGGRFDMSYTRNGQATLFINKMLDRDVGWYEAVASNEHGQARQRVRLEIAEFPDFIRRPDINYSMVRGKARFEARITGNPYPNVKWYKDWKPLAESSRIKIKFTEPDLWILTIDDVILKDAGLYSVSAGNVGGSISSSAMLYVDENDFDYKLHTYGPISPIRCKRKIFDDFYDLGDELGRGTQGITYHGVERTSGNNYATKIMHGRDDFRPYMRNELDMMNQLRHRRLINLHDAYETDDSMILVMELGGGGELVKDYLLRRDYYTESDIAFYMKQLLEGIHYMHDRGYGHMGLNIGDLLLSHLGGYDLKITDFGLTRRITRDNLYPLRFGVPEYTSPEAVRGEGTGFGHDMWSIGIITHILLSGRSPFLGRDDRETLTRIKDGSWAYDMSWWSNISVEARDFISRLLVYSAEDRMDIYTALRHPWLERAERRITDEYRISSTYLRDYYYLFREWYDNSSCRRWYRRRPLEGAFTHPSRMVYPPGDVYTPPPSPPASRTKNLPGARSWEDHLPSRSPLNYEIGLFKSESHYQNGPDTYLLQLRDVNFPVRVREYMKVAANRGPGRSLIVSNENGFDWQSPTVRERRRFTDIMDEEIDDERKARINNYGADNAASHNIRRLRRELGPRLDTYAEAEAMMEMKQEGRLPFFREKPQATAMMEGKDLDLTCYVVGDPQPVVQWFKNDAIVVESARVKIETDSDGRTHFKLRPALGFDLGMYKVVARNKIGQTIAHTRIVYGTIPDAPDSPTATQISDTEILLIWKPPKSDGNSTVLCYSLQYKLAEDSDWIKKASNIDHEFYLMSGLEASKKYMFRLAANNAIGWSEQGVPTAPISTLEPGAPRIQLSSAMKHLQQITDSGKEVDLEVASRPDYNLENSPIEWSEGDADQDYSFISEISRGKFSAVFKGVDKRTDKLVVAKLVDLSTETADNVDGEFAALRSLRHERIAGLLAAYRTSDIATFVLEKLQGANVLTYLASRHEYSEQTVATIVSQILDGLQYLHWRNLCHLDIQPDNVVMCGLRSVQVKLVDFGSAHRVTKLGTKVPIVGHPDYISPEVLNEELAYPQTDIWSLGVLTYVMLSGVLPFQGADANESRQNISFVRYRFEYLFQELSQEGNRFIMLIFKRNPNKRPTAEECHENRWLLPTDSMIKKRERAVFLGNRLKEYSEKYHNERVHTAKLCKVGKSLVKSYSIQEELSIAL